MSKSQEQLDALEKLDEVLEGIAELKKAKDLLDEVWTEHTFGTATFSDKLLYKLMDYFGIDQSE